MRNWLLHILFLFFSFFIAKPLLFNPPSKGRSVSLMLRPWPQIKARIALQPPSWCQSKSIRPVMTDRTSPNPCESRGRWTELNGARLPQHAWEMASTVREFSCSGYWISFDFSRTRLTGHLHLLRGIPLNLLKKSVRDAKDVLSVHSPFIIPCGQIHLSYQWQRRQ